MRDNWATFLTIIFTAKHAVLAAERGLKALYVAPGKYDTGLSRVCDRAFSGRED